MKKTIYALSLGLLVAGAMTLSSCTEDDLWGGNEVVEGVPVTATMTISGCPEATFVMNTRAEDNSLSQLYDLTIFIFDGDGNYQGVASTYEDPQTLEILNEEGEPSTDGREGARHQVRFKTTSGTKKLIAVGNLHSDYWYDTESGGNLAKLDEVVAGVYNFGQTKELLMNIKFGVQAQNAPGFYQPIQMAAVEQMPLSGWNEGVVIDTNGSVRDYGRDGIDNNNQVAVRMERTMAHITFSIVAEPEGAKGTFIPTSYTVYNIPKSVYMTNKDKINTDVDNGFVNYTQTNVPAVKDGNYTFDFYMPENIYAETSGVSAYHDRDTWTGETGASASDKTWTNAPQTSTFIVISGTYDGTGEEAGSTVNANVEYTIHLGDFSEDKKADNNFGNYSVERNCSYTYKVQVLGVDNIIVEATTDNGEQQGAEGNVYDRTSVSYAYNLDCHYEQVILKYNLSDIAASLPRNLSGEDLDNAIANQLVLVIQSEAMDYNHSGDDEYTVANKRGSLRPYKLYADAVRSGEGAATVKERVLGGAADEEGTSPTKGFDYKWIEFWPQTDTLIAKYPGISTWAAEDLTGVANLDYYEGGSDKPTESAHLMDVYDVIVAMGKVIKDIYNSATITTGTYNDDGIIVTTDEGDYVACFTAFVSENFNIRHPLTGKVITMWSVLTNKIPREMIIAMSTDVSTDGNSTYSKIHSYISQLSMQTFYNSRVTSINAFGIETYNETPVDDIIFGSPDYPTGYTQADLDDSDGRKNQRLLIGITPTGSPSNIEWDDFISYRNNGWTSSANTVTDHTKHKLSTSTYVKGAGRAYYACMSRNRDLNGNGMIDENEIRWFLASVNGYIRMGMGASALSSAVQLYVGDKNNLTFSGYPQNFRSEGAIFFTSSKDARRIYWAVEKGSYGTDGDWTGGVGNGKPLRCIRTLPAHEGTTQDISSLYNIKSDPVAEELSRKGADGTTDMIVLKFKDKYIDALYRNRVNGSLDEHDEDGSPNSFSEGIFVASSDLDNKYDLDDIIGYGNIDMVNPCSSHTEGGYSNWRVPNLVELLAMTAIAQSSTSKIKLTDKTMCCTKFSNSNVRYGFALYGDNGYIYCPGGETVTSDNGERILIDGSYVSYSKGARYPINCYQFESWPVRCVRDVPNGYFDSSN